MSNNGQFKIVTALGLTLGLGFWYAAWWLVFQWTWWSLASLPVALACSTVFTTVGMAASLDIEKMKRKDGDSDG